jgi:hypothetical protein
MRSYESHDSEPDSCPSTLQLRDDVTTPPPHQADRQAQEERAASSHQSDRTTPGRDAFVANPTAVTPRSWSNRGAHALVTSFMSQNASPQSP